MCRSGQFVLSGKLGDVSYNAWDKSLTGEDKSSAFFVGDISSVSLKLNGLGAVSFKSSGMSQSLFASPVNYMTTRFPLSLHRYDQNLTEFTITTIPTFCNEDVCLSQQS